MLLENNIIWIFLFSSLQLFLRVFCIQKYGPVRIQRIAFFIHVVALPQRLEQKQFDQTHFVRIYIWRGNLHPFQACRHANKQLSPKGAMPTSIQRPCRSHQKCFSVVSSFPCPHESSLRHEDKAQDRTLRCRAPFNTKKSLANGNHSHNCQKNIKSCCILKVSVKFV